jgi:SNF family Na+-dependent transporter
VFWWFFSVFFGGFIPIAVHLIAVLLNADPTHRTEWSRALVADGYLYMFIVALSTVVDALADEQSIPAAIFGSVAAFSTGAYFGSLTNFIATHPIVGPPLGALVWLVLPIACLTCATYKILVLYGLAKDELSMERR